MSDLPPCCYENEDGWHYCQEGLKLYRIAQKLTPGCSTLRITGNIARRRMRRRSRLEILPDCARTCGD